jgi:hypothetical protein
MFVEAENRRAACNRQVQVTFVFSAFRKMSNSRKARTTSRFLLLAPLGRSASIWSGFNPALSKVPGKVTTLENFRIVTRLRWT